MRRSIFLPAIWLALAVTFASDAVGQNTLIPVRARRDFVFDHSGAFLYISTADGLVKRFNLHSNQVDRTYNIGGSLVALDIAPDDSCLIIAQNNYGLKQGVFHRLDPVSGTVQNIYFQRAFFELGGYDVAIASNGLALVTTQFSGSGTLPLRQINLATNEISIRADVPDHEINLDTQIARSADGSRLFLVEPNDSAGPVLTYDAASDSFKPHLRTDSLFLDSASCAVNRDGTLLGTRIQNSTSLDTKEFSYRHSFVGPDGGIAFDAVRDVLYAVSRGEGQIVAYDSNTFGELFRLNIGETLPTDFPVFPFGSGNLAASNDGRYLALETPSGVRVFDLQVATHILPPPPSPTFATRRDMVFDHAGRYLYLTTVNGLVERYDLVTQQLDVVASLGGFLSGMDISPDDSFLLVAQGAIGLAQGGVQRIDLATGAVSIINYGRELLEGGAWDVAIVSNTRAFVTTFSLGSSTMPLREIDIPNNSMHVRNDAPGVGFSGHELEDGAAIHRSADRSRLYFIQPNFTYDSTTNQFGRRITDFRAFGAVNRDGSRLATRIQSWVTLDTAPDFHFLQPFTNCDSGVAFDASRDILYAVRNSSRQVVAFDTNTFEELFRLDIGEALEDFPFQFSTGNLVASQDGRYLAVATLSGVKVLTIPEPLPAPSPTPLPSPGLPTAMVFDHSGHLYVANANQGLVFRYNASTGNVDSAYPLGGFLRALDIAADDSFLLVTQELTNRTEGMIHKIDLASGEWANLTYPFVTNETGGASIAIASNGLALFTVGYDGSGSTPLRQLDTATGQFMQRTDFIFGNTFEGASIFRSADRSRLAISQFPILFYDSPANNFTDVHVDDVGVGNLNRDGSLTATTPQLQSVALWSVPGLTAVHNFPTIDMGVAFDPVRDVVYGISHLTGDLIGYDTSTFAEKFRVNVRTAIGNTPIADPGTMITVSPDGHYIAVAGANGLRFYSPTGAPTPTPTPSPTPSPVPTPPPTNSPTPIPTGTPVVGVGVTAPGPLNPGIFTVGATPNTIRPVNVNYTFSGTAVFGVDYDLSNFQPQTGSLLIPVGFDSAQITLNILPTLTRVKGRLKTIIMTLTPGPGYKLSRTVKVKLKL